MQRQPAREPTLGGVDRPHTFYRDRSAIVAPAIDRNDYEVKPQLIQLVEQRQFNGLSTENPIDHIERFEKICGTTKANGVSPDYLKCKLFEFSLADKATSWLNSLPAASLVGWEAVRAAFLDHYYTKSKTASLKAKITSFRQVPGETFNETWERFKKYRRDCPHHGYSDVQLLNVFYDGVNWESKNSLNAASNGNFMTRNVASATELINNLAESSNDKDEEYDRSRPVNSVDSKKIDELTAQIKLLRKANQRDIHSCEPESSGASLQDAAGQMDEDDQEINYVQGQGFNNNRNHPNFSYRSNNVANPQDQVYQSQPILNANQPSGSFQGKTGAHNQGYQKNQYNNFQAAAPKPSAPFQPPQNNSQDELKSMMQLLLANQQATANTINSKVDGMYNDLNGKFEALNNHVKKLDIQVAQTAEAMKRPPGTLPGRPEMNPRTEHVNAITVSNSVAQGLAGSDGTEERTCVLSTTHQIVEEPAPERTYTPRVPYPRPPQKSEEEIAIRFNVMSEKLKEYFPSDEVQNLPVLTRCIMRRSASHCSIQEGVRLVADEVNAVLLKKHPQLHKDNAQPRQTKLLQKVEDPGKFAVPCSIAGVTFKESLCDSGSSVNIMSREIAEQLHITDMKPAKITLAFADSSTTIPYGTILNLHVSIGNCIVCTDFQVVEMTKGSSLPLILGRPFMATVGALMDLPRKRMSFTFIDTKKFYAAVPTNGSIQHASSVSVDVVPEVTASEAMAVGDTLTTKKIRKGNPPAQTKQTTAKTKMKGTVQQTRMQRPFTRMSIVIPPFLRNKEPETIKQMLQGTMQLFPNVVSWQIKEGVLAAVGTQKRDFQKRFTPDTGDPYLPNDSQCA